MTTQHGKLGGARWSRRRLLKTGLAASTALTLGACCSRGRGPNVVLVTIDTLRPDRLHCYGNPRPTSPCIDGLAADGILFRNAFSTAPWTLPAHLSLFTSHAAGKYFQSVGSAGRTGDKAVYPIYYRHQGGAPTIASVFRDRGHDTVGFHSAMLTDALWGLDHGFREYSFSPDNGEFERASAYVRGRAGEGRPFFLFVHSYVVHRPFRYESAFGDPAARPPGLARMDFTRDLLAGHELTPVDPRAPLYGWRPQPEEIDYFRTVYDGGVLAADRLLQGLIDTLQAESLYDDTAIVVTADHGEEFWEHVPECSPDHNHSLFDELLRIPLIVKPARGTWAGREAAGLARIHDVGPTLYDLAGIPLHAGATGASLLPQLTAGGSGPERHLYAACTYMGPTRYCVRTAGFKYIQCPQTVSFRPHFQVPAEALYDLAADPLEQRNIVAERPDVAADLRARLALDRAADLPLSLTLDDPMTRNLMPSMGLEEHAQALIAEGRGTAELPLMSEASQDLQKSLRALGYL